MYTHTAIRNIHIIYCKLTRATKTTMVPHHHLNNTQLLLITDVR